MTNLTAKEFGRPLRCENALLRALNIHRYIMAMAPSVVMELGPGSGYLGLLLILDGIGYIGCENSQAFYLLQNRIWGAAAQSELFELAGSDLRLRDLLAMDMKGKVAHIPWWKIIDLDPASLNAQIDLVTANHCLCEMQTNAAKYYLRLSHDQLSGSRGTFVFEGWGDELLRPRGLLAREFLAAGFALGHADERVTAFMPAKNFVGEQGRFPLPVSAPRRVRSLLRRLAGLESRHYDFMVGSFCGDNPVSKTIRAADNTMSATAKVGYDEIVTFLHEAYPPGTESLEERFLAVIGKKYL